MKKILNKLYTGDSLSSSEDILATYKKQKYVVVDFMYFAIIHAFHVFRSNSDNPMEKNYRQAILSADFLLPDGIALQIFYYLACKRKVISSVNTWLANLNGTDFIHYFMGFLKKTFDKDLFIILYGTKPEYIQQTSEAFEEKGYQVLYAQHGYNGLNWKALDKCLVGKEKSIKLFLQARSAVDNPMQELRSMTNLTKIKKYNLLVMNVGGFFDFVTGVQKRAPKILIACKLEWLYRLFSDPKRNYKKVLNSLSILRYIFVNLLLKKG